MTAHLVAGMLIGLALGIPAVALIRARIERHHMDMQATAEYELWQQRNPNKDTDQ